MLRASEVLGEKLVANKTISLAPPLEGWDHGPLQTNSGKRQTRGTPLWSRGSRLTNHGVCVPSLRGFAQHPFQLDLFAVVGLPNVA